MGILLGSYIGTTIASIILLVITEKAFDERLKREGYKTLDDEKGSTEKLRTKILNGCLLLIPLFNIVLACQVFFQFDKVYKEMLEFYLEDGVISKNSTLEMKNAQKQNSENMLVREIVYNKPYSQMTVEEKLDFLEREKNFLLSINRQPSEQAESQKKPYVKNNTKMN